MQGALVEDLNSLFVASDTSFHDVLTTINRAARGIALVVDVERRLTGVITDGDARRAILAGVPLTAPASAILSRKPAGAPITVLATTPHSDLVALVQRTRISHLPIVNDAGQVVDFFGLDDLLTNEEMTLQAVVMAGGFGSRLLPLTASTPKPMLPIGDRPLMEHIIRNLSDAGIRQVSIATHYLADKITDYFGDGERFGVTVRYMPEEQLLGTVGAVALVPDSQTPMLVINGDILTTLDFRAMLSFHREHCADLTVAVRRFEVQVPYGVVNTDGEKVLGVTEKPVHSHLINAGIYLLEPSVRGFIPRGERYDMTELMQALVAAARTVICFPVWEYWRDIGHRRDYEQAQADAKADRLVS